jgi:integrase
VTVLGKGRLEPEKLPLSPVGAKALRRWLEVRGGHRAAPVFIRLDRGARGEQRLTDQSVYDIALARGLKAGIARMRPHGLRHLGITRLANYVDAQGLPVGEGMKLSRHRKEETYRGYIDRKGTLQDRIVEALADA